MTQFNFKIDKNASRFHFYLSLTGINPVMGSSFISAYLNIIGSLSENEQKELLLFKSKYLELSENERKSLLINSFLSKSEPSECLPNQLDDKFEAYWKIAEKELLESKRIISEDLIKQEAVLDKALKTLDSLFNRETPEEVTIFLISSPVDNSSGKYITDNVVYVEIPQINQTKLVKFWLLLLHEIIHACYEPFEYKMWLKQFAEKQPQTDLTKKMGPKNILRELLDSAISGRNGYFSDFLYSIDIRQQLIKEVAETKEYQKNDREKFSYLKKTVALRLYDSIDQYVKKSKKIDESTLRLVWKSILKEEGAVSK